MSYLSDNEEGFQFPMTQNPYFEDSEGIWIFPRRDVSEEEEEEAGEVVDDQEGGAAAQGGGNSTSNEFRTDR